MKQSILVVDDEELIRMVLQDNLEREGFEVGIAESAETALTALNECPYNLLLTDYLMEGINGIELMQQARELYPEIKVIIFSGFNDEELTDKILGLGADYFFCKSDMNFDELLEGVSKVMTS